jgi:hypothetical protein
MLGAVSVSAGVNVPGCSAESLLRSSLSSERANTGDRALPFGAVRGRRRCESHFSELAGEDAEVVCPPLRECGRDVDEDFFVIWEAGVEDCVGVIGAAGGGVRGRLFAVAIVFL